MIPGQGEAGEWGSHSHCGKLPPRLWFENLKKKKISKIFRRSKKSSGGQQSFQEKKRPGNLCKLPRISDESSSCHSNMSVNVGDPPVCPSLVKLRCDNLFTGKHHSVLKRIFWRDFLQDCLNLKKFERFNTLPLMPKQVPEFSTALLAYSIWQKIAYEAFDQGNILFKLAPGTLCRQGKTVMLRDHSQCQCSTYLQLITGSLKVEKGVKVRNWGQVAKYSVVLEDFICPDY